MTLQDFIRVTTDSLNNLSSALGSILPNLIAAIVIFLIGLIVAAILVRIWSEVTKVINLERSLGAIDAYQNLVKTNKSLSITEIVSGLVWWTIVLVFAIAALKALDLQEVDSSFALFFDYLPRLISGALILVIGSVFAWYSASLVSALGTLAKLAAASMISKLVSLAVMVFSLLAALSAFGVNGEMLKLIVQVTIVATGLAFALGGRDAASDQIKKIRDNFK